MARISLHRPTLPRAHANPLMQELGTSKEFPTVKYQVLTCQGQEILVGRLKIPTPLARTATTGPPVTSTGHAFILRRFDTGAISLTTMFRAAFPTSSEADEKAEINWVKDSFDLSGNNGSSREPHLTRLAGTWVSVDVAKQLAKSYQMEPLIEIVVQAQPDPEMSYRKSGKSTGGGTPKETSATSVVQQQNTVITNSAVKSLPTPSPTNASNPPAKRRKESSPAPQIAPASSSPVKSTAPLPRRSTRSSRSPAPRAALTSVKTKRITTVVKTVHPVAEEEEEDPVDKDVDGRAVDKLAADELHKQDVQEQRAMIEGLKAQRDEFIQEDGASKLKRAREEAEAGVTFDFKEPEVTERAIVTNRRVNRFKELDPQKKSAAWGVAAFAVAMGVTAFLPNFF